jgi:hypothetical protein
MSNITNVDSKIDKILNSVNNNVIEELYLKEKIDISLFTKYISKSSRENINDLNHKKLAAFKECIRIEDSKMGLFSIINRILDVVLQCFGRQSPINKAYKTYYEVNKNIPRTSPTPNDKVKDNERKKSKKPKLETKPVVKSEAPKEKQATQNIAPKNVTPAPQKQAVAETEKILLSPAEVSQLQRIQTAISKLDLGSKQFSSNVLQIITQLENYAKKFPQNAAEVKGLIFALKTLQDPKGFDEISLEGKILEKFETVLKKAGFETSYRRENTKSFADMARRDLLKFLKSPQSPDEFLSNAYIPKIAELRQNALKNRLNSLCRTSSNKTELMISNIVNIIRFLKHFEREYEKYVNETIDAIYQRCDEKTNGRFSSELMKYYDYCDMRESELVDGEIENFLEQLSRPSLMSKITQFSSEEFNEALQSIYKTHFEICEKNLISTFKDHFREKYNWIVKNNKHIKKPENQGKLKDINCQDGTCYQNTIERERLLIINPEISADKIKVRSSEKGRFIRAQLNQKKSFEKEDVEKLGVASITRTGIPNIQAIFEEDALKFSKNGSLILELFDNNGDGHAINVQFNPAKNIYRFIDDNFGICEFDSAEEFKREFSEYMNLFYSDYHTFYVELFSLLGPKQA